MAGTGQTINDRINAVRYALVGQGLARTVCKATTEEVLGPKKKHLDYLLVCTQEPNVSIPQMANLLIERTQHANWAVVFKGLSTIHHLMAFGNERFTQYLATSNHSFDLPDFMDRSTPQGYSMSTFVRRYSKYVNEKCTSYRNLAIDICKLGTGNDNPLRTMNMDKLSKTLPIVHQQYDLLLEFNAESKDLNNGIIMAAFRLLYKDLVRLYIAYQEAIINLLERYFKLSRKKTREALNLYKQYLSRMDKVAAFFKVADQIGLDKSEMPDLTKSPASILVLLEQHLAQLEAKKKGAEPQTSITDTTQKPSAGDETNENRQQTPAISSTQSTPEHHGGDNADATTKETIEETENKETSIKEGGDEQDIDDEKYEEKREDETTSQEVGSEEKITKVEESFPQATVESQETETEKSKTEQLSSGIEESVRVEVKVSEDSSKPDGDSSESAGQEKPIDDEKKPESVNDDDDEQQVSPSKKPENKTATTVSESATGDGDKPSDSSVCGEENKSPITTTTSKPAHTPPPKPARPSPLTSPKNSQANKEQSTSNKSLPAKPPAPPGRPPKPPSRPPPPSATTTASNQATTSSSSSTPVKEAPAHPPPPQH